MMGSGLRADVEVTGGTGLHARPASVFVSLAKEFRSDVRVYHDGKTANGKSMVSMLQLGVERGGVITITADGPDAAKAIETLQNAVAEGLGEEKEAPQTAPPPEQPVPTAQEGYAEEVQDEPGLIRGIAAAPGIAIAPVHQLHKGPQAVIEQHAVDAGAERSDLDHAIDRAGAELEELHRTIGQRAGRRKPHFPGSPGVLEDPDLIEAARFRIDHNNERRLRVARSRGGAGERTGCPQRSPAGGTGQRPARCRRPRHAPAGPHRTKTSSADHEIILVAEDLSPSDTAALNPDLVKESARRSAVPNSHLRSSPARSIFQRWWVRPRCWNWCRA